MKKIYTLIAALIFISATAFSQTVYKVNNITIENKTVPEINLMANPVRGEINLRVSNPNATKYAIALYSTNGQIITTVEYNHPGGVSTETMHIPDGVMGMCYLIVKSTDEPQRSLKVFIES